MKRLSVLASVLCIALLFCTACGETTVTTEPQTEPQTATVETTDPTAPETDGEVTELPDTDEPQTETVSDETTAKPTAGNTTGAEPTTAAVVTTTTVKPVTVPTRATTKPGVTTTTVTTKPTTATTTRPYVKPAVITADNYYGYTALKKAGKTTELEVYEALAKGVENMDESIDLSKWKLTYEEACDIYNVYTSDYPQHFWRGPSCSYVLCDDLVDSICVDYLFTKEQRNAASKKFEKAVEDIMANISGNMSDFEKELALHDAIIDNAVYRIVGDDSEYSAYGALVNKEAVCEGYSRAFQYLCYLSGIPCTVLNGESKGVPHIWNVIKVDGDWYHLDVTWDDPDDKTYGIKTYYDYFNLTEKEIKVDHTIEVNPLLPMPACTATKGNFFNHEGLTMGGSYSHDAMVKALVYFAERGTNLAQIATTMSESAFGAAMQQDIWNLVDEANLSLSGKKRLPDSGSVCLICSVSSTHVGHYYIYTAK